MHCPSVSFILRVKNEARDLAHCIQRIRAQRWDGPLEVVAIDSGSTDGTLDIARSMADIVITIEPYEFHFSRTLNKAIEASNGELLAILSGHSIITDDDWLIRIAAVFDDDSVAGASCRQIPWPDAAPAELRRIRQTFPDSSMTWSRGDEHAVVFSNAAAMIRRSAWRSHPFDMAAVEDLFWARWALQNGMKIAYVAEASVVHSHNERPRLRAFRMAQCDDSVAKAEGRSRGMPRILLTSIGFAVREARFVLGSHPTWRIRMQQTWETMLVAWHYFWWRRQLRRQKDG